jgi:hypothetical protein
VLRHGTDAKARLGVAVGTSHVAGDPVGLAGGQRRDLRPAGDRPTRDPACLREREARRTDRIVAVDDEHVGGAPEVQHHVEALALRARQGAVGVDGGVGPRHVRRVVVRLT